MRWWLPLVVLISSAPRVAAAAEKNADLARAQRSFEELKYPEAGKALEAAWAAPGNGLEDVLEILRLQAVVAAAMEQQDRARALFRTLLYLAPDFVLPEGELGPKVMSLYYEAKGRQSVEGGLRFEPSPPGVEAQRVRRLSTRVTDRQALGRSVRFHTRAPGQPWAQQVQPLADGAAQQSVDAATVEWWAELLGEAERVLARVGAEAAPLVATAGQAAVEAPKPPVVARAGGSKLRPVAYAVAGVGALAAIGASVFAVQSNGQRNQILTAARDADGRITGLTREKAVAINAQIRASATAANTLFIVSGALVVTGVVLFVASSDVKLTAAPGGVGVQVRLP